MPFHARSLAAAPLAALLLAGCMVGPAYQRPAVAAPIAGPVAAPDAWWSGFADPMLVRVIARAAAANLDIAQAEARVLQSRAQARGAGAGLLPSGAVTAQAQEVRQSLEGPIGSIGRHLPGFARDTAVFDVGGVATWDPDLSGGLKRSRQAARAEAEAAADHALAVRLAVTADAADAYLQVRAYQARLDVAQRQESVEADLVELVRKQAAQGVAPDRELRQTRAALEGVRATLPPLRAGLDVQLDRLDVLLGSTSGPWRAALSAPAATPVAPTLRPGDGEAGLLRRRPDILAAEQRLIAANARIGQALAEYYPKVSVSALLGVDSLDGGRLFTPAAFQAVGSGALRWRLFDFGRVDAEVAGARAADAEALALWRATALRATAEVADAVTDLAQQQARAEALQRQIAELTIARRQAQQAYQGGAISLLEVREADRNLLAASDQLAQARAGAARAAVAAWRAFGGGWTAAG